MKTWTIPTANAQKFAANEYVSACFSVRCVTPNNNALGRYLYEDTNNSGTFEKDIDKCLFDPGIVFDGCGGYHTVTIQGDPADLKNNCFIAMSNGEVIPYFYWSGSVINPKEAPQLHDIHGTDLTRDDVIIPAENPNFS